MKIVWLTDIHLNFLDKFSLDRFVHQVKSADPDILFIDEPTVGIDSTDRRGNRVSIND